MGGGLPCMIGRGALVTALRVGDGARYPSWWVRPSLRWRSQGCNYTLVITTTSFSTIAPPSARGAASRQVTIAAGSGGVQVLGGAFGGTLRTSPTCSAVESVAPLACRR